VSRFTVYSGYRMAMSPDNLTLATTDDERIYFWNYRRGINIGESEPVASRVLSLAYSSDGKLVAAGSEDGSVTLISTLDGSIQQYLYYEDGAIVAVVFFSDLLAAGSHGHLFVWEVNGGILRRQISGHSGGILSLAASPRGGVLVSGGDTRDGKIMFWGLGDFSYMLMLYQTDSAVNSLAYSPDGRWVVAGLENCTIQYFDSPQYSR